MRCNPKRWVNRIFVQSKFRGREKARRRYALILDIYEALRRRVAEITGMRRPEVHLFLREGVDVGHVLLVREYTGRQARNHLGDTALVRDVKDVVVDEDVIA